MQYVIETELTIHPLARVRQNSPAVNPVGKPVDRDSHRPACCPFQLSTGAARDGERGRDTLFLPEHNERFIMESGLTY
jgi:hypothetical protein